MWNVYINNVVQGSKLPKFQTGNVTNVQDCLPRPQSIYSGGGGGGGGLVELTDCRRVENDGLPIMHQKRFSPNDSSIYATDMCQN